MNGLTIFCRAAATCAILGYTSQNHSSTVHKNSLDRPYVLNMTRTGTSRFCKVDNGICIGWWSQWLLFFLLFLLEPNSTVQIQSLVIFLCPKISTKKRYKCPQLSKVESTHLWLAQCNVHKIKVNREKLPEEVSRALQLCHTQTVSPNASCKAWHHRTIKAKTS